MVSTVSMLAMGTSALLSILLPVMTFLILKKKFQLKLLPVIAGAGFCLLFVMILEHQVNLLVLQPAADGTISLIRTAPLLYILYGVLAAGIFEETARLICFLLLKKKFNGIGTAIAYAVGHGGFEMIGLYGTTHLNNLLLSLAINGHHTAMLQSISQSALQVLITSPSRKFLLSSLEMVPGFFIQIFLSLLVWYAVNHQGKFRLYPLAILIHALVNIPAGLWQSGLVKNTAAIYIIFYAATVFLVLLLFLPYHLGAYLQEKKTKKEAYQNLLTYAKELEGLNDELSSFKHDYINILMTLEESFRRADYEQAAHIFYDTIYPSKELIQTQKSNIQKYARIRIPELRNLMISKELHAKEEGVEFKVELIGTIKPLEIKKIDLIRAVSILIDNAVEATKQNKTADTITLSLIEVEGDFSFSCQNSIIGLHFDRSCLFNKYYSTKNELLPVHGLGLYSLNQILDKNPLMTLRTRFTEEAIIQTINIKEEFLR